ncbi:unnamed protein product [Closterium sp. NIES-53]
MDCGVDLSTDSETRDAILAAMYVVSISAEGDCYMCVPPDPSIEAATLGASESAAPGTSESAAPGANRTTLTPLIRPVALSLADPSGGPVLTHYSTVLPCPAAPSGSLSGLYLPSFSTNLVSGADLQDGGVDQFTPASQRVTHCTCARTCRHLATFTRGPGSSLYTLTIESPPVAASGQLAASSQVVAAASRSSPESAPCLCRLLSHQTLLWHHRLGHPSLPHLRGMASRVLVSGLKPRAAPHSSEFPPTEAPLQTLHMDVWGPARVRGQGHERYFLLVVDDYSRYTTVFPLRSKGEVTEVLIDWIRIARLQLRERFGSDFPVLRLHSDRGGEFSFDLLRAFCRAEGIRQTFTLPASPQQNGIAERRIGMVMDVARTSMIHAAAPHFLWPFAVQYAAHQLNLQPQVSMPETSPTLRWTGKVGDASAFRVWGSRAFVRDLSADKLSSRAVPCVFLGFPPDAPGWQFYHPTSHRVLSSQDVTFDESVPYYRLFPYRTAPLPPPATLPHAHAVEPVEVAVDSGTSGGAEPACEEPGGAGSGGAEPESAEPGGAGCGGAEPERAETEGAGSGGAEPGVAEGGGVELAGAGPGGPSGALFGQELPSPQELREWFTRRWSHAAGAGGTAGAGGSASAGGAGAMCPGGARTGGTGAAGRGGATGARAIGAAGAGGATRVVTTGGTGAGAAKSSDGPAGAGAAVGAGGTGAGGAAGASAPVGAGVDATRAAGATARAGGAAGVGADAAGAFSARSRGATRTRPYFVSLLEQVLGLPPSSGPPPSLECPPPVQSESQLPLASPLPAPSPYAGPTGGLAERREPESRPASPVRTARTSRRVPHQRPPAVPSTHQMVLRPSTACPPPGANIVSGMWIFRVKRPPGSPPVFKARYMARGFSQRQGVDYFQTFSSTPKMTTLRVLLHVAAHRDYELHSLDFSTAFLQGSLHEEIWLRRPPGFTGTTLAALGFAPSTADPSLFLRTDTSLPPFYILVYVDDLVFATADTAGLAHMKAQRTITLTQSHMVQQVLQRFDFTYSSPQATPLSTRHSLSALPSDDTSGMGLVLGGRSPVVLTGDADASWVDDLATQRSSQGYTFSLDSGSVSWRSTRSSSVLSSSCEAEIYAGAMAAHFTMLNKTRKQIGRAHSENGVYILDFSIPYCIGDSQELIDLVPLRFKHIHHRDWKHPIGTLWVPHHPHPRELALHDPDPDGICRDCQTPTASTSAIASRGLAAIAEAEREALPEKGLSTLELETATRVVFGTEEHPLHGPASQTL